MLIDNDNGYQLYLQILSIIQIIIIINKTIKKKLGSRETPTSFLISYILINQ